MIRAISKPPARNSSSGATALRCKLCGGMVRQQIGFHDADPQAAAKNGGRFTTRLILARQTFDCRSQFPAYACGCSVVVLAGDKSSPFPNGTWACAGHPPVEGSSAVLPPMTQSAANNFALMVTNSHLQQTINLLGITFTDGNGMVAMPANVSLGGGMPALKPWTNETTNTPVDLDFATVAGACVQLTDKTVSSF